jgi:aminopeptidase N
MSVINWVRIDSNCFGVDFRVTFCVPSRLYSHKITPTNSGFCGNPGGFHTANGDGYKFVRSVLEELDPINASVSSRLSSSLITWKKYNFDTRGKLMKNELEELSKLKPISNDLFEIVSRGLN